MSTNKKTAESEAQSDSPANANTAAPLAAMRVAPEAPVVSLVHVGAAGSQVRSESAVMPYLAASDALLMHPGSAELGANVILLFPLLAHFIAMVAPAVHV